MTVFTVSLVTVTPVVIGQWLTLDAILDGILEADEIEAHERIVPLLSWDGQAMHADVPTSEMGARGLVHVASALMPYGAELAMDESDPAGSVFASRRPRVVHRSWRRGVRPVMDFPASEMPFSAGRGKLADKFDIKRGPGAASVDSIRCLAPGKVEWVAQGDPERVVEILRDAVGIGGKTRAGMGRFDPDSILVEDLGPGSPHPLTGILDTKGKNLWRPVPEGMIANGDPVVSRLSMQTCRSPYWDRSRVEAVRIPVARHHDGILSL